MFQLSFPDQLKPAVFPTLTEMLDLNFAIFMPRSTENCFSLLPQGHSLLHYILDQLTTHSENSLSADFLDTLLIYSSHATLSSPPESPL